MYKKYNFIIAILTVSMVFAYIRIEMLENRILINEIRLEINSVELKIHLNELEEKQLQKEEVEETFNYKWSICLNGANQAELIDPKSYDIWSCVENLKKISIEDAVDFYIDKK